MLNVRVNKQNGRINNKGICKDSSAVYHHRIPRSLTEEATRNREIRGGKLIVNFDSITRQEVNTRPHRDNIYNYSVAAPESSEGLRSPPGLRRRRSDSLIVLASLIHIIHKQWPDRVLRGCGVYYINFVMIK